MLTIIVEGAELYDEENQEFKKETEDVVLELEHSLAALSKWESKWEKPFLGDDKKTTEETLSYIECMTLTPNIPPEIYPKLTNKNLLEINAYIDRKMTATWFSEEPNAKKNSEKITAELVYYWMSQLNIPFECENWNLNRLFTLIKIANIKQSKPKRMSRNEILQRNRQLNEQRRAKLGTTG